MDKTDFIEVNPPLGPVVVLRGNYCLIRPAFDENGVLQELGLYANSRGSEFIYKGNDARKLAGILNKRFDLSIGKSTAVRDLDKVREVKSLLDGGG